MTVAEVCREEIHRLHRAIVDWTTGAVPNTDDAFAPFGDSFAPSFVIINPGGQMEGAATVVPRFRDLYGTRARDFAIRITDEDIRLEADDRALIVYQERWFDGGTERSIILSSALTQVDAARPGGVAWLHLHEAWLKPPAT